MKGGKQSSDAAANAAIEAKRKAEEEKAISDADSKAKAAKIAEMQNQLAAAKAASEKAAGDMADAKGQAASLTDEVGLLKKQVQTSTRNEETAQAEKDESERRIQSMEAMARLYSLYFTLL